MDYIAKHYVRFSKTTYTPGEFIDEAMTEEQKNRLLKLGAIAPCEQTVFSVPVVKENADAAYNADDGETEETEQTENDEEEAPVMAPEINVMDGIGKPKKTTRRGSK